MPIPNAGSAYIPPEKLIDYLLNEQHPVGGGKAEWFRSLGYDAATLDAAIQRLVRTSENFAEKNGLHGVKYVVSGKIATPNGSTVNVTTVWIVERSNPKPRLVTAYPGE